MDLPGCRGKLVDELPCEVRHPSDGPGRADDDEAVGGRIDRDRDVGVIGVRVGLLENGKRRRGDGVVQVHRPNHRQGRARFVVAVTIGFAGIRRFAGTPALQQFIKRDHTHFAAATVAQHSPQRLRQLRGRDPRRIERDHAHLARPGDRGAVEVADDLLDRPQLLVRSQDQQTVTRCVDADRRCGRREVLVVEDRRQVRGKLPCVGVVDRHHTHVTGRFR